MSSCVANGQLGVTAIAIFLSGWDIQNQSQPNPAIQADGPTTLLFDDNKWHDSRPSKRRLAFSFNTVIVRSDRKSQVRKCLGFCFADFWSPFAFESAEQKL